MTLTPLPELPKNVRDLDKLIVAKGFKKLSKSPINRPIWSHCFPTLSSLLFLERDVTQLKISALEIN